MGCGGNIFVRDISQNIMQTAEDKDEVSHYSKSATCRKVYKIRPIAITLYALYDAKIGPLISINRIQTEKGMLNLNCAIFG